jgi:hypothetical protein
MVATAKRPLHVSGIDFTMTHSAARSSCCGRHQTEFAGSGFEHYCRYSFQRSSAMDIWSSIRRHESNFSQSAPRRLIGCWLTREDYATDGE